jgi:hypothetical protein
MLLGHNNFGSVKAHGRYQRFNVQEKVERKKGRVLTSTTLFAISV